MNFKKIAAIFLCFFIIFGTVFSSFAEELSTEQKNTLDETVEDLKTKQGSINETKTTITEINAEIEKIDSTIKELDDRMASTKEKIAKLEEKKKEQEAELEERLRAIYMFNEDGYLEVIFSSTDIAELLSKLASIHSIMQSDRNALEAIEQTKKEIEDSIADEEKDKENAEILKEKQKSLLVNYEALLAIQEAEYASEHADADVIAKTMGLSGIDEYLSELEWPIDKNNSKAFLISDWFGYRPSSSTDGVGSTNHKGIDIACSSGTPILAAASGVVTLAEYYSGYGNCVVIEHGKNNNGDTISTLYGHQTRYIVSVGDHVNQGDVIGYVGSTGNSTGPHLHFEVWVNQMQTDPMTFFERYRSLCTYCG